LSIAKRLSELMGGGIRVQSLPAQGSTFTLTLPFLACKAPQEAACTGLPCWDRPLGKTADEALQQGRLVLVAEDNPTNRDILSRQLLRLGLMADLTNDGQQAMKAWRQRRHPLVLTDCHMPEMDGYALAKVIREEESRLGLSRTPVIAVTASVMQEELDLCSSSGMDEALAKPIEPDHLLAILAKWLPAWPSASQKPQAASKQPQEAERVLFDPLALVPLIGDDAQVIAEVLNDFLAASEAIILEIGHSLQNSDAQAGGKAGHKLKSSARSVGANVLADLCMSLEAAGKANDLTKALGLAQQLAETYERTRQVIRNHIVQIRPEG
jgi:CheY-like chemotaxis protein/HPt (histidine-containing phosphotransfer) domain-containing protein